jgi:transcriptional regulator with XRE-family HTH domain
MTPNQLRQLRKRLGLTQKVFAEVLKVAPNTVARWERGEIGMRPSTQLLLEMFAREVDLTYPSIPKLDAKQEK